MTKRRVSTAFGVLVTVYVWLPCQGGAGPRESEGGRQDVRSVDDGKVLVRVLSEEEQKTLPDVRIWTGASKTTCAKSASGAEGLRGDFQGDAHPSFHRSERPVRHQRVCGHGNQTVSIVFLLLHFLESISRCSERVRLKFMW